MPCGYFTRPLGWTMRKRKVNDVCTGGLLLLLLILLMNLQGGTSGLAGLDRTVLPKGIFIQVSGSIKQPGIYGFFQPPHLTELLARAGGPHRGTEKGKQLKDVSLLSGRRIEVRSTGEETEIFESEMSAFHKITLGLPISLNRETKEGLTAIPGIGPKIARDIMSERVKRGGFQRLEEILSVQGIGPVVFEKIRPYLAL